MADSDAGWETRVGDVQVGAGLCIKLFYLKASTADFGRPGQRGLADGGLWLLAWLARFCSISHFGSFMLFSIFYAAWLRTRRATAAPAQFGFARFQISPLGCRWHHPDLVCSTDLNPKPNTATGVVCPTSAAVGITVGPRF